MIFKLFFNGLITHYCCDLEVHFLFSVVGNVNVLEQ